LRGAHVAARAALAAGFGDTLTAIPSGMPLAGPSIAHAYQQSGTEIVIRLTQDQSTDILLPLQAANGAGWAVMDGGSVASPGPIIAAVSASRIDATHLLVTLASAPASPAVECLTVTIFALYASALAWLVGQSGRQRAETRRDIENLEALGERGMDKLQTQEAKSRQELTASLQAGILSLQQQVNQLRDGSATKPELAAVEQRLAASLNEFKAETRAEFAKIAQKVDRLPAMEDGAEPDDRETERHAHRADMTRSRNFYANMPPRSLIAKWSRTPYRADNALPSANAPWIS
jgi:hypothetical protein